MIHAPQRGFEAKLQDIMRRLRRLEQRQSPLAGGSVTILESSSSTDGGGTTSETVTEGPSPPSAPKPGDVWIVTL